MIFLIKHRWWLALLTAAVLGGAAWRLGGWRDVCGGRLSIAWQVVVGLSGGVAALAINGAVHEALQRAGGPTYLARFDRYRREVLDGMHWPAYLAGGWMAAVGEEPLFRGCLLRAFHEPVLGITVAAVVFALCHWLRIAYWGFWLWAMWEGLLFGILLVATGSLLVPMLAHGLHDVAAYRVLRALAPEI